MPDNIIDLTLLFEVIREANGYDSVPDVCKTCGNSTFHVTNAESSCILSSD